jgi:hypothetical protein
MSNIEAGVKFCPYCGGRSFVQVCTWTATSQEDEDNECALEEFQCYDCDAKSFWA